MMWLMLLIAVGVMAMIVEITEDFKVRLMESNYVKRELLEDIKNAITLIEEIENNDDPTKSSVHKNSIKEILSPLKKDIEQLESFSSNYYI